MAFRIHQSVLRGEIDNRVRGVVCGKLWVEGRAEPIVLELAGNAHPDLAGCLLTFKNRLKAEPLHRSEDLATEQRGPSVKLVAESRAELFTLRGGILKLMNEFRRSGRN